MTIHSLNNKQSDLITKLRSWVIKEKTSFKLTSHRGDVYRLEYLQVAKSLKIILERGSYTEKEQENLNIIRNRYIRES